jgi:hypothetical protein
MKFLTSILAMSIMASSHTSAFAQSDVSTDFIEGGRVNVYFDDRDPSADGYYISGRKTLSDNLYLVGDYFNTRIDDFSFSVSDLGDRERVDRISSNNDFKELSLGLGYLHHLSRSSFLRLEAKYYDFEQEIRSDYSSTYNNPLEIERETARQKNDHTGSIIEAGYRFKGLDFLEFDVGVGYRNISVTRGVYAELSGSFLIGQNWQVTVSTEQGDTDRYMLGLGYRF